MELVDDLLFLGGRVSEATLDVSSNVAEILPDSVAEDVERSHRWRNL
jgi:hypothetical protein